MAIINFLDHDLIEITPVVIEQISERAALVDIGRDRMVSLPLALVDFEPIPDGRTHTVSLPAWLARVKGIIK